jgi:multidrug resistance protein, MATE family
MIHGKFGCPAFGFEGAAWATLISRIVIFAAMILWLLNAKGLREWVPYRWFRKPESGDLKRLLAVGFPASIQMVCEVTAFSLAGLMMGRFGPTAMAAHQIAITLAGTAFMIPLGLSMALTVRIGEADGAGQITSLRPIVISGWILATFYAILAAGVFLVFGQFLASLFIQEPRVISLTASLLVIVGIFQLFDSLQVASASLLRGLQDVRVPAVIGFMAFWIIGLPVGAGLGFGAGMGAIGVWWGLAAGLFVASITLGPRLWKHSGRAISNT